MRNGWSAADAWAAVTAGDERRRQRTADRPQPVDAVPTPASSLKPTAAAVEDDLTPNPTAATTPTAEDDLTPNPTAEDDLATEDDLTPNPTAEDDLATDPTVLTCSTVAEEVAAGAPISAGAPPAVDGAHGGLLIVLGAGVWWWSR
ncbi:MULTISPECIES: hypothetical protein [unclassified Actinoplanes]|uniref:hypothetical protein n=1 Tax=unclassified Actinoplanes TaxID=2626549 RepID=UPI0012BAA5B5|nr:MULTISPECIES: hypothetical protein [unclassified Actinoplanes]